MRLIDKARMADRHQQALKDILRLEEKKVCGIAQLPCGCGWKATTTKPNHIHSIHVCTEHGGRTLKIKTLMDAQTSIVLSPHFESLSKRRKAYFEINKMIQEIRSSL